RSGFASADSTVAAERAKPTEVMSVQSVATSDSRLFLKSVSELDWTSPHSTPSWFAALTRPSYESWLKLLSSKPPASETMQGLKPSTAGASGSLVSVSVAESVGSAAGGFSSGG